MAALLHRFAHPKEASMHSRATIAALVFAISACANEERPSQTANESHPPQTTTTQEQYQQRPPMAMQGESDQPPEMQPQQNQQQPMNPPPADQNQYGQPGQEQMTGQNPTGTEQKAAEMGDPQIVGILVTLHKGEIEEAKLVDTRAKDAQVKKFAQMMVNDHTSSLEREQRTALRLNIKAADSDKSRQMEQDAKARMDELKNLTGAQFDKQYMDNAVKEHTEGLVLIDSKLLANVKNPELKTLIENDKTKVSKHLAEARDIQRRISAPVTQR
jgi:putative membrane protein